LPITVSTVTDQFISDTSARRTRDIVGYVPGVNASEDDGGTGDLLNIRGFDFDLQTFLNGMHNRVNDEATRTLDNIQRIEILKGPGGVEFGAGLPGGFVNYVTKKPQATPSLTLGAEYGSYDYYHGFIDATGPLWVPSGAKSDTTSDASKRNDTSQPTQLGLFYRFIASGDSANSFRDFYHTDGELVAPSLLWNYAEGSSVLLEFEYQHRDQPYDRGIFYLENAGFSKNFAPSNLSLNQPGDFDDAHLTRTSLYWNQKLNDAITFRLTGEINTSHVVGRAVRNPKTFVLYQNEDFDNSYTGDPTVPRSTQVFEEDNSSYGIKPEFLLNFKTGPITHTGLLGFNFLETYFEKSTLEGFDSRPVSFRNPNYGAEPVLLSPANPLDPTSIPIGARDQRFEETLQESGVYYQHKFDLFDRVHLLGGVRYDWYDDRLALTRNIRATPLPPLTGYSDQNLSWRVGGVIDLCKNVSLFAGYSRSFQPQSGLLEGGENAPALAAASIEMGIKASFFHDTLQSTLSFYQTTQKNLLEADPKDLTNTFLIPIGTVRIRGVEWETTGRLTRDLDVQGGFSCMASEITETQDPTTLGREFHNVPDFQAGLRLRYDTSRWLIKGLSLGGGAVYVGSRPGDDQNSFSLPFYWRFDAGLYYRWRNWNFKLTCQNLFDKRYYLASQGFPDTIQPGAPRLFTFGAQVTF